MIHPSAAAPLRQWEQVIKKAVFQNTADLRLAFSSADFVGDKTVFNIGGNKFRLIAFVHYPRQIVFIKHILTHKNYDRGGWK